MSQKERWAGKKIYCVGIKGAGISGLTILLKREGAVITGSDIAEEFPSEKELKENGIVVKSFSPDNITSNTDLVIYSSAWSKDHAERVRAGELHIPEMSYAEALGEYAKGKKTIVVTGTHGKTTTTALLGQIFEAAGLDPNVLTGDLVKAWGSSVHTGKGDYFIVEGDEYQEKFKFFSPVGIIIPALDYDHPDYFKDVRSYQNSFLTWLKANPEAKFVTTKEVEKLLDFKATCPDKKDAEIFSKVHFIFPGAHYRQNLLLVIKLARLFGISEKNIIKGVNAFRGVGRRLDFYSPPDSKVAIVYDYAHHPVEIKATLGALKEAFSGFTIIAVFQPHTYTRTKVFLEDFAHSFAVADSVFFEEIYASARERGEKNILEDLIAATKKYHPRVGRLSAYSLEDLGKLISREEKNTLVVFMGAGDIWQKAKKLALLLFGKKGSAD